MLTATVSFSRVGDSDRALTMPWSDCPRSVKKTYNNDHAVTSVSYKHCAVGLNDLIGVAFVLLGRQVAYERLKI